MNCNFSQPVDYTGAPPTAGEPFAFTQMTCTSSIKQEITGPTTQGNTGDFWLSPQIDYGQILILTFLLIFFVGFAVKFLWNFTKQDVNEKL